MLAADTVVEQEVELVGTVEGTVVEVIGRIMEWHRRERTVRQVPLV